MASMAIEWIPGRDGARGMWWLMLNGTCLFPLDLSEKANDTEIRMLAEQELSQLVKSANVFRSVDEPSRVDDGSLGGHDSRE